MQDNEGPFTLEEIERSLSNMEATLRKAKFRKTFLKSPRPPAYYNPEYWISYIKENFLASEENKPEPPLQTPDGFEINFYHAAGELRIKILRAGTSEVFLKLPISPRQARIIASRISRAALSARPDLKTTGTHTTCTRSRPKTSKNPSVRYLPYKPKKHKPKKKDQLEDAEAFHAFLDRKHSRAEPLIQLPSGEWVHIGHATDLD